MVCYVDCEYMMTSQSLSQTSVGQKFVGESLFAIHLNFVPILIAFHSLVGNSHGFGSFYFRGLGLSLPRPLWLFLQLCCFVASLFLRVL